MWVPRQTSKLCSREAVTFGARAVKPPQDVFWGGYHACFADLDGYLWEVAFNPFTDLK